MNILIALNTLSIGGAEMVALRLSNHLARNHKVYFYLHNDELSSPELKSLVEENVHLIYFHRNQFINFLTWKLNALTSKFLGYSIRDAIKRFWIKRFIKNKKIEILNSHSIVTDGYFASCSLKTPLICTLHGEYELWFEQNKTQFYLQGRVVSKVVRGFIYLADKSLEVIVNELAIPRSMFRKIYNGFKKNQQKYESRSDTVFTFGMVARGIPEKGWLEIIEAFKILLRRTKREIKLVLVGGGDLVESLLKDCRDLPIVAIPVSYDPLPIISNIDVGVLPTYNPTECLPNFLVECLSLGKPAIATTVGEIRNMLKSDNGPAGLLIDLDASGKPDIIELAEKMIAYLDSPELFAEHSNNARKAFEKFDFELIGNQYIQFYKDVIDGHN